MNTIYFRNQNQVTLFECELKGQLSDGRWENWDLIPQKLWDAKAKVAEYQEQLGTTFDIVAYDEDGSKGYPDFADRDLVDVVGRRMINWVKLCTAFPELTERYAERWDWEDIYKVTLSAKSFVGVTATAVRAAMSNVQYGPKELRADLEDMSRLLTVRSQPKPKPQPKLAAAKAKTPNVFVHGYFRHQAQETLFMNSQAPAFASNTVSCDLHVTVTDNVLTVASVCVYADRVDLPAGKLLHECAFTQYQWTTVPNCRATEGGDCGYWTIVDRTVLMSEVK